MKKTLLSLGLLASLIMVGCSHDDVQPAGGDNGNESKTSYLAIRIASSELPTRTTGSGYEDGTSAEQNVQAIRFYFFYDDGSPAYVKYNSGSMVNYYDYDKTIEQGDETDPNDIESFVKAVIVISTKDGDKLPQRMAAIINPTGLINATDNPLQNATGDESLSLSELRTVVRNFTAGQSGAPSSSVPATGFVMFNSVYADAANNRISTAVINESNLQKTEDLAKENPVKMYVERNVAKVRVNLSSSIGFDADSKLALKTKVENGEPITIDDEQVYLKLNGWSLTAVTNEGYMVKSINPTAWANDDDNMTWWQWTIPTQFRSCWAINTPGAVNQYYNYTSINSKFIGDDGKAISLYTNENAQNSAGKNLNRTKVILNGTLVNKDGNPFTIYRHYGVHFADDSEKGFPKLKASILSHLRQSEHTYYYQDGDVRKDIDANDIEIVAADQLAQESSQNNCYVYAKLTKAAEGKTWYNSQDASAVPMENAATTINGVLKNKDVIERPLVWKDGMTYYYYEIIHVSTGSGENYKSRRGVVRNHIYNTNVTGIAGLGTPVYDPTLKIYPEKPNPNDHYIAAEINILAWHVVGKNYQLEW